MTIGAVNRDIKKQKKIVHTIIFIIIWDLAMFYQIFISPQVQRYTIITYKHGIYKLPH